MKNVLIIDDEDAVRFALKRVLERAGYHVRLAPGGAEGIAAMREQAADVVITDIVMPKVHGVDTIKAIAQEFPHARIVAISGGGNFGANDYKPNAITTTAYLTAAQGAGAHAVLTKPFETRDVLQAINGG